MKEHGFSAVAIGAPIEGWILSDFGRASVYLFRGLSAAFVAAVVCWIIITISRRRPRVFAPSGYRDCLMDCFNSDQRSCPHPRYMALSCAGNADGGVISIYGRHGTRGCRWRTSSGHAKAIRCDSSLRPEGSLMESLASDRKQAPAEAGALSARRDVRRVAVLVPCYNEEKTIMQVITGFRTALPEATIYVYDNNSEDRTADIARRAGAVVRQEIHQGKGHVVRRMFADVEADAYVLVDGDATYNSPSAGMMVEQLFVDNLDMVVGARAERAEEAYRRGHRMGNRLLGVAVAMVFGRTFVDMLSGFRVFSHRFVKSFPALSTGFEIETELTVHALELDLPVAEVRTPYYARPEGSQSKLKTWQDGLRILWLILKLCRSERPLAFFSTLGAVLGVMSVSLAIPIFTTYVEQGIVPRLPTAVLSTGLMLLAWLCVVTGLVLDTVTRGRREMKLLAYLAQRAPKD